MVDAAERTPGVELVGVMTHFATADELDDGGFFAGQLRAFARWAQELKAARPGLLVHAANSAAMLREPAAAFDMVRAGIAIYGMDPFGQDPAERGLEPALELRSYVADVKPCRAGESAGYGRRFIAERDTVIGVLPIGYGDGWRRGLTNNCDVLIGGARRSARRHDLDGQRDRRPRARRRREPARRAGRADRDRRAARGSPPRRSPARLDTINYEITCGLTPRVPRVYHRDGAGRGAGSRDQRARARHGVSAGLDAAREALAGSPAWLVGGALRDALLGRDDGRLRHRRRRRSRRRRARRRARRRPRRLLPAVGGVRQLARRRARQQLAGRRRAAAGGDARGRSGAARLHRQRDRPAARRRRGDRSARRRRGPARAPAPPGRARLLRAGSRCGCCASCASPSSSA